MGIFQKQKNKAVEDVEEDAATIPTLAQWKQQKKQERKARIEARASQKARRSQRIDQLVYHRQANQGRRCPQNEYCSSPQIVREHQQAAKDAAGVGWSTTKIAVKGILGLGKKSKSQDAQN